VTNAIGNFDRKVFLSLTFCLTLFRNTYYKNINMSNNLGMEKINSFLLLLFNASHVNCPYSLAISLEESVLLGIRINLFDI